MQQLPLPIRLDARATLENYIAGANREAVDCLRGLLERSPEIQVFIWSRAGRGKTHLLQALCHAAGKKKKPAAYLPLPQLLDAGPEILAGLERLRLVCVDDVETVCERPEWAEALFHLINRCRANSCPLVFTAARSPQSMPVALPDLASRFLWGQVFHLKPLEDGDLVRFLNECSAERGLEISADAVRYLMQHGRRDIGELIREIDLLDEAALARKRRITLPFAREVLGL